MKRILISVHDMKRYERKREIKHRLLGFLAWWKEREMAEGKLVIFAEVKGMGRKGWIENAKTDKKDRYHAEE